MHRFALALIGAASLIWIAARPAGPSRAQLESLLREALVAWAAGDEAAALATLRRVDQQALDAGQADLLRSVKQAAARNLRRSPGALAAFLRLEERAYVAYAAERDPTLAGAVRQQLPGLIQEAAGRRASTAERVQAARLLASFGGALQGAGQSAAAAEAYTLALLHDPRQAAAYAGLAALHERRGEHTAALARLRQLVVAAPADREARLRLATVLARSGAPAEAEWWLRPLAITGDDWIRSLAAQELGRSLVARGEVGSALALLEAAAAALPCDSALQVQTGYVAERTGQARLLDLATLADCGEAGESARARYTRPPQGPLTRLRDELARLEADWRVELGEVLARGRR